MGRPGSPAALRAPVGSKNQDKALSQPGALWRARWGLCWSWGYPVADPHFFRSEQQSGGGSWRTRFPGQGPWQPPRPSGSVPRRGAACSRAARILPHPPPCPAELVRPRGSVTRSSEPAPHSPPPWMCADPGRPPCAPPPLADAPLGWTLGRGRAGPHVIGLSQRPSGP